MPDGFFTVEDGRHVLVSACTLIPFYFASAKHLTSEERLFAVREVGLRLRKFGTLEASWSRIFASKIVDAPLPTNRQMLVWDRSSLAYDVATGRCGLNAIPDPDESAAITRYTTHGAES